MSNKLICDYCLQEIASNYTAMSVQTVTVDGSTAQNVSDTYEFHPSCYNAMMVMSVTVRSEQQVEPIDPTPPPPKPQPTNPDDPPPPKPKQKPDPEPAPDPAPDTPAE